MKHIDGVIEKLSELFSEALGVSSDYLASTRCFRARSLACHYFPICPEISSDHGGNQAYGPRLSDVAPPRQRRRPTSSSSRFLDRCSSGEGSFASKSC